MGLMTATNANEMCLAGIISDFFVNISTAVTFPVWTFLSAGVVNFFVPSGGGQWVNKSMPERWTVSYGPLTFNIKPMNFKHTGLFPEQAANWDFAMEQIKTAGRPVRVLNLFAYTGGATIAAALPGQLSLMWMPPRAW